MSNMERTILTFVLTILALALMSSLTSCKTSKPKSKVFIHKYTYYTNQD